MIHFGRECDKIARDFCNHIGRLESQITEQRSIYHYQMHVLEQRIQELEEENKSLSLQLEGLKKKPNDALRDKVIRADGRRKGSPPNPPQNSTMYHIDNPNIPFKK